MYYKNYRVALIQYEFSIKLAKNHLEPMLTLDSPLFFASITSFLLLKLACLPVSPSQSRVVIPLCDTTASNIIMATIMV